MARFIKSIAVAAGELPLTVTFASLGIDAFTAAPEIFLQADTNRALYANGKTTTQFVINGFPGGVAPPFTVSATIEGAGAFVGESFKAIKDQVRYTMFQFPDGQLRNLFDDAAEELIPIPLIDELLNKSQRDVNMDVLEDAEVFETVTVLDEDDIALPTDILLIKDIVIFAATTDLRGFPLEKAANYASLVEQGFAVTGSPTIYMLTKKTRSGGSVPVRVVQFNKTCDAAYKIEIHYWVLSLNMTSESDLPEIFEGYHDLIVRRARYRIAELIGDPRFGTFLSTYNEELEKAKRLQGQYNAGPSRVRFGII